jgi:hypothetical protein
MLCRGRTLNIEISTEDGLLRTIHEVSLIIKGHIAASWKDKNIDLENEYAIRTINQSVIEFRNGAVVS